MRARSLVVFSGPRGQFPDPNASSRALVDPSHTTGGPFPALPALVSLVIVPLFVLPLSTADRVPSGRGPACGLAHSRCSVCIVE